MPELTEGPATMGKGVQQVQQLTRKGTTVIPWIIVLAQILFVVTLLPCVHAQVSPKPLSKDAVIKLLQGDVSPERVEELVRQHGIDFVVTSEMEGQLRKSGATDSLLAKLKESAPKPTTLAPVPVTGGLQGVYVKTVTLSKEEAKSRFGLSDLDLSRDDRYTLIDHLDDNSDAARAGIRAGDYVNHVILAGDELGKSSVSANSEADFYRLAARCIPDCIVGIRHAEDLPSGSKGGFLPVGNVGTNFEIVRDSVVFDLSLKDKVNGHLYGGILGPDVVQRQLAIIRSASHGLMVRAESTPTASGDQSVVTVQNNSPNFLTFIFSGPVIRQLLIAPGNSETFKLPPGDYEIASIEMFSLQVGKDRYVPNMQYRFIYPQSALIGVGVVSITQDVKKKFPNGIAGVLVSEVKQDTPAEAAGLHLGDVIQTVVTADGATMIGNPSDFGRVATRCAPDCLISVRRRTYKGYEDGGGFLAIGGVGSNFLLLYGHCSKRVIAYIQTSGKKRGQRYIAGDLPISRLDSEDLGATLKPLGKNPSVPGAFITQNLTCASTSPNAGATNSN